MKVASSYSADSDRNDFITSAGFLIHPRTCMCRNSTKNKMTFLPTSINPVFLRVSQRKQYVNIHDALLLILDAKRHRVSFVFLYTEYSVQTWRKVFDRTVKP